MQKEWITSLASNLKKTSIHSTRRLENMLEGDALKNKAKSDCDRGNMLTLLIANKTSGGNIISGAIKRMFKMDS
eukprot:CCRYP_007443-RG/>CCRYP_007443-RG protein AED:0.49 eAED:1.00 QI:0/0/0/1/0/0/2/0/73